MTEKEAELWKRLAKYYQRNLLVIAGATAVKSPDRLRQIASDALDRKAKDRRALRKAEASAPACPSNHVNKNATR